MVQFIQPGSPAPPLHTWPRRSTLTPRCCRLLSYYNHPAGVCSQRSHGRYTADYWLLTRTLRLRRREERAAGTSASTPATALAPRGGVVVCGALSPICTRSQAPCKPCLLLRSRILAIIRNQFAQSGHSLDRTWCNRNVSIYRVCLTYCTVRY